MNDDRRSAFWIPWASVAIILLTIYGFVIEMRALHYGIMKQVMGDFAFSWPALVEAPFASVPRMLSYTFLHANQSHIVGNLIFFAVFAPAVERAVGHVNFALFYVAWGAAAAVTQGIFEPGTTGLLGASGAISGAAGAYFVLFPLKTPPMSLARVFGRFIANIPAFFWIGLWFLAQLKGGYRAVLPDLLPGEVSNVAYWCHVGGFAAGALTSAPFVWGRAKSETI